ncbi:NUC173-domain-containing protein [Auricularia subglabra TFB-10046 SS5]|nr:NUC173-domain-containing protein [Auricularia subglabra TFB-10046 SS5]
MSDELNEALAKIRPHTSSGLAHQKAPAVLLQALEATLKEQKTDATPTAYFASLLTALDGLVQKDGTRALSEGDNIPAALYLLALVAPFVPPVVLRSQLGMTVALLAPLFPALGPHAPALRSQITIFGPVTQALDAAHLNAQGVRQVFASLLELTADPRPKVRKKAAEVIKNILEDPPAPLARHPYAEQVAVWAQKTLAAAAASPIRANDKQSDGAEIAIHILAFLKPVCAFLPSESLSPLATTLLSLPRLGNPYLSQSAYNLLAIIISDDGASEDTPAPAILKSILASPPSTSDTTLAPAWVVLLGKIMASYSDSSPDQCAAELPSVWQTCWGFLESSALPVREGAEEALVALTTCISPGVISGALSAASGSSSKDLSKTPLGKLIATVTKSLDSVAFAKATPQILTVLSALVLALRTQEGATPGVTQTPAELLLMPLIEKVGNLRTKPKFVHKEAADNVLDTAMRVMGPEVLLRALPLNIEPADREAGREPRAFLLALLPHAHPTPLSHFVSYFVPLSERMFDYQQKAEAAGNAAEAKMWNVLVLQIWAGLAGYAWNPVGLRESLTPVFSKLLANLLHSQQPLHAPILNALRLIAEVNAATATGEATQTIEKARLTFDLSQEEAKKNLEYLRQQAGNWLATLFNVFGAVEKDSKGMVGAAIGAWAALAGEQEISKAFRRVQDLLKKNLALYKTKPAHGQGSEGVAVLQASEDLLLLLLPHLSAADSNTLFAMCLSPEMLGHWDGGVQKRCYRLLARLVETGHATVDAEVVLKKLLDESQSVAPAAKRDRFALFAELLPALPAASLHMITVLIPETVLGTKEPSEKARTSAFDLLVAMGTKMREGGVVRRDKVEGMEVDDETPREVKGSIEEYMTMVAAGLAGATPHMISASVTAISRLIFEFKDDISHNMLSEILSTLSVFLSSANREIVKSTLGFVKLAIHSLPHELVHGSLPQLVPALLNWSHDHKNHFKAKVQHIFERMIRRFGYEEVVRHAEKEEGRKVLQNIKKRKDRAKRKKAAAAAEESEDEEARAPQRTGDAFEDVLYGSESEADDSDDEPAAGRPQPSTKKGKSGGYQLRDDPDDPMDLLDGAASKLTLSGKKRQRQPGKDAKHFKTNDDGRLVIDEDDDEDDAVAAKDVAGTAYRELQSSADGFTRNSRGQVKFNKDTKKRRRGTEEDGSDVEMEITGAQNKSRRKAQKLGQEFKAKVIALNNISCPDAHGFQNAGGDVKRGKIEPYAYMSLGEAAKKTSRKGGERVSITGRR